MSETEDKKHACDSICEEFGCTDDAEKNNELESQLGEIKSLSADCSLFMDLMNNESMIESVQAKLGIRGYFLEHVLKHNLVSEKLKEEVRTFLDESVWSEVNMNILYPASIIYRKAEGWYFVKFFDLDEAFTEAESLEEALFNAGEVLTLTLEGRIDENIEIPKPSARKSKNTYLIAPSARVQAALLIRQTKKE